MNDLYDLIIELHKDNKSKGGTFYLDIPNCVKNEGSEKPSRSLHIVEYLFLPTTTEEFFCRVFQDVADLIGHEYLITHTPALLQHITLSMPFRYDRYLLLKSLLTEIDQK